QWIRHRTANVNEYSGRYSVMKEEFYVPQPKDIRLQSSNNRQGRSEAEAPPEIRQKFLDYLNRSQTEAYAAYNEFLEADIARELARINLPLSMYTEWYWKIDLHNLFHFLQLRLDEHAQEEIRVYAEVMAGMVRTVCPVAYEAFADYRLNSVLFSRPELAVLQENLSHMTLTVEQLTARGLSKREAVEFIEKLDKTKRPTD
ncbi:MAG: FAD-dependent thymidylate synthase, partial [candidate division Zixibacteria bacterium]|nr:FAD-dependent thymidylate synthase [candidate division Zixibacteria bacterium]